MGRALPHVAALAVSLALLISVTAIYTPFYSKKKKDEEGRSRGFWREVWRMQSDFCVGKL